MFDIYLYNGFCLGLESFKEVFGYSEDDKLVLAEATGILISIGFIRIKLGTVNVLDLDD